LPRLWCALGPISSRFRRVWNGDEAANVKALMDAILAAQ
jgi:hypothetical protein